MDKSSKSSKSQKTIRQTNVLESLKDIGGSAVKSIKKDLLQSTSEDFFNQLWGKRPEKRYSGDIFVGESLEVSDVLSGKHEENIKLKRQFALERRLAEEERARTEKRSNELKVQLQAIIQEVIALAQTTQNLSEEVKVASIQAPADPGLYHLIFFEKLLEFIRSFRKKIENASVWLQASNQRAQKRTYWSLYKQHGSKFLLSPDHYLQRSAG